MTSFVMTSPDDKNKSWGKPIPTLFPGDSKFGEQGSVESVELHRQKLLQILEELHDTLEVDPNVWGPTSAWETLRILITTGRLDNIEGKSVIDVGCGTGIFGILLARGGAGKVTFVDNNVYATEVTQRNIEKFGLNDRCDVILSDVFDRVPKRKYDILTVNPPFNPYVEGVVITNPAERSNQNEDTDGVKVLSTVIENLYKYLKPEVGVAFLDLSSRQGIGICTNILDSNLGEGNWGIINPPEQPEDAPMFDSKYSEPVDFDYIRPFLSHLTLLSERDGLPRIMYPDSEGNLLLQIKNTYRNPSQITYIIPNFSIEANSVLKNGASIYKVTTLTAGSAGQTRITITNTSIDASTLAESPVTDIRKNKRIADIAGNAVNKSAPHHQFIRVEAKITGEQ